MGASGCPLGKVPSLLADVSTPVPLGARGVAVSIVSKVVVNIHEPWPGPTGPRMTFFLAPSGAPSLTTFVVAVVDLVLIVPPPLARVMTFGPTVPPFGFLLRAAAGGTPATVATDSVSSNLMALALVAIVVLGASVGPASVLVVASSTSSSNPLATSVLNTSSAAPPSFTYGGVLVLVAVAPASFGIVVLAPLLNPTNLRKPGPNPPTIVAT